MIAIVGGGVAGVSAAETLREFGFAGELCVFCAEPFVPYDRPALSKRFLLDRHLAEPPALRPAETLAGLSIKLELGAEVLAIDARRRTLTTVRDDEIPYDLLLLATGAGPRRLNVPGATLKGIHYLRTRDDARLLRSALRPATSVAIIGGGVIGMEVAASATQLGATVTVIEAAPRILTRIAPGDLSALVSELHRARGVAIRTGAVPIGFEGASGQVHGVALANGDMVQAQTVVVGVGAAPRTDLAASAGLAVDDGILVDERFRSSEEGIFAAGDVARVLHESEGRHVRIEQWGPAQEQGRLAAASMLGAGEPYRDVPWMWSDQHDLHMQATGFGFAGLDVVHRGTINERTGIVYFGTRGDQLVAAAGVSTGTGVARTIRSAKALIERGAHVDAEQLADPDLDLRRLARSQTS